MGDEPEWGPYCMRLTNQGARTMCMQACAGGCDQCDHTTPGHIDKITSPLLLSYETLPVILCDAESLRR